MKINIMNWLKSNRLYFSLAVIFLAVFLLSGCAIKKETQINTESNSSNNNQDKTSEEALPTNENSSQDEGQNRIEKILSLLKEKESRVEELTQVRNDLKSSKEKLKQNLDFGKELSSEENKNLTQLIELEENNEATLDSMLSLFDQQIAVIINKANGKEKTLDDAVNDVLDNKQENANNATVIPIGKEEIVGARAKSVFEWQKNIFVIFDNDKIKQITFSNFDSMPALSHSGERVAFIRNSKDETINNNPSFLPIDNNSELWVIESDASNEKRVKEAKDISSPVGKATYIFSPVFSINDNNIFFLTDAWAVSSAVFSFDLASGKMRYITDGNTVDVIENGQYKGNLLLNQHQYYKSSSGSYDYYNIVDESGKMIKTLGSELEKAKQELDN